MIPFGIEQAAAEWAARKQQQQPEQRPAFTVIIENGAWEEELVYLVRIRGESRVFQFSNAPQAIAKIRELVGKGYEWLQDPWA